LRSALRAYIAAFERRGGRVERAEDRDAGRGADGERRGAPAIVHRLEAVEIDIDQRRAGVVALHIGERTLELALETAAVERVGSGSTSTRASSSRMRARVLQLRGERVDLGGKPHDDGARRRPWRPVVAGGALAGLAAQRRPGRPGYLGLARGFALFRVMPPSPAT
jgi:hypothetical protein